jgi:ribosomal protein L29
MAHKTITERRRELTVMNSLELENALAEAHKALYNIRRERLSKPADDVKATRAHRKEIARILTIQRQREIAAQAKSGK